MLRTQSENRVTSINIDDIYLKDNEQKFDENMP